ncbi:MAG: DNA-directed RNA polymerase I 135 kDa polypeptide [Olpidium bornovanus]|uniref:DNA-directed RNA polymerase subunit beta n=1 Tax=Olpidium bornovanus TaxID=278681 RepID=A0A8H7ZUM0_9FUNG|nr:MAG: DNA-directed RNA polymerase I 135 kDa polypeptide [Olpidium bornovanus]
MCPVHPPDGSPCGLLNHLSHSCEVVASPSDVSRIPALLASLGVAQTLRSARGHNVTVQLDGKVVGWCTPVLAKTFPGLYLFSEPARMTRPVVHLATGKTDYVGPFEQVYLDVACASEEALPGVTTHLEETPTNMLSVIANLTPFSDFNQSPRNMYQPAELTPFSSAAVLQMGKQTMGTPAQALAHRTDNKMYRLQTGQTPIVRPALHERYGVDGGPNGTNAVVAVISYTGYDMEDAMIINKSAHERGFGHGSVYKSEWVDLGELRQRHAPIMHHFGVAPGVKRDALETVDVDGLPIVGVKLVNGSPMYAYVDDATGKTVVKRYKGMEDAYVDQDELQRIQIKLRIPRPPIIGDKFSSRHGQKGVCSQKYPAVDLPFSESGMQPDVIINPHAFPSRMTIGMFVESIAAKSGALHGIPQDATPFTFSEQYTAADYFGEQLLKAGYNYHGNEPMYSGVTGEEFKADIYIGVVYYQRLRHMVADKYQVRTTGPVHNLTQQPLKGRKRAGGIRFGEMERDSLLAHGVSYLLQDRLMNCSDYSQVRRSAAVFRRALCGSIVSALSVAATSASTRREVECRVCGTSRGIDLVAVPYVFRYLATELMAMNIKLTLEVTSS